MNAILPMQRSPDIPMIHRSSTTQTLCPLDHLIASSSMEEHQAHLKQVLQRLSDHGIIVNPAKWSYRTRLPGTPCQCPKSRISSPSSSRLPPTYFSPNCAKIFEPLSKLLRAPASGACRFNWGEEAVTAFNTIQKSSSC